MQKKWILSSLALLSIVAMGTSQVDASCDWLATAEGKATWVTNDVGRTVFVLVKSGLGLVHDGENAAELIAKQEEDNEKAGGGSSGGGGGGDSEDKEAEEKESETPGASEFLGSAYSYVKSEILGKEGNIGYTPLKQAVSSASAGSVRQNVYQAILDNFFVDMTKENQRTPEYQRQIENQRQNYVEESTKRHMTFAYKVKGFIQNDLLAIPSAALSCGCELASLAINAHTLEEMVKSELVDLSMQIEMMEADAIQLLMEFQSPILMAETKELTYASAGGGTGGNSNNSSGDGTGGGSGDNNNSSCNGTGEDTGDNTGNNSSNNGTEGGVQ